MKTITSEHIIIILLVALLYLSYTNKQSYRYQSIDKFTVFDKKTGTYHDVDGYVNIIDRKGKSAKINYN